MAAKPQLLIVEGDPIFRRVLPFLAGQNGFQAELVDSVQAALEKIHADLDRLILDLTMPDGLSIPVLQRIRDECWPIKVAVVTDDTERQILEEVTALRPDLFVFKSAGLRPLIQWLEAGKVAAPSPTGDTTVPADSAAEPVADPVATAVVDRPVAEPPSAARSNQRSKDRGKVRMGLVARLIGKAAEFEVRVDAVDISSSGIGVLARQAFNPGQYFVVRMHFGQKPAHLVLCRTSYCRTAPEKKFRIGAAFVETIVAPDRDTLPPAWYQKATTKPG